MDTNSNKQLTMTSRRENRLAAVQFLYMWEVNPSDSWEAAFSDFFAIPSKKSRSGYAFTEDLVSGTLKNIRIIDENIKQYSQNWTFSRIAKADLAILRLAIYELLFRKDIPPVVSINEAIDLAKSFSSEDSKRFINGILDKVKGTLNRPERSPEKN